MFRFDARPSIRRSLVMWLVLPLALLVPATAFLFYRLALAPALDSLDHALDGTALALEKLVRLDDGVLTLSMSPELDGALRADRYDEVHWVALGPDGHVLGGDRELATLGGPPSAVDWRFFDAHLRRPAGARRAAQLDLRARRRRTAPRACARRASRRRSTSARASRSRCWRRRRRRCWSRRWCWP